MTSAPHRLSLPGFANGIEDFKRNAAGRPRLLSGQHSVAPLFPVVQPCLRVWHQPAAVSQLTFELTEPPPKIRHGGLPCCDRIRDGGVE
jgi:hypothetical protein